MKLAEILPAGVVVSDGAWGTQFIRMGLDTSDVADRWNLLFPERVVSVAQAYVDAGSQVILTNTFRANAITLAEYGCAAEVEAINRAGVELSKRAATGKSLVFGSMGPTGKVYAAGEVSEQALFDAFVEQSAALASAQPDALLIETMSDVEEARVAVKAALTTGLPVVASFVFDAGRNRDRTMTGATPEQVVAAMQEAGVSAVGANCGSGIEAFVPLARRIAAATTLPVWIKANAGLPEIVDGEPVYRTSAEGFATHVPALVEAGARIIGGCCGTTPDFIRAIVQSL